MEDCYFLRGKNHCACLTVGKCTEPDTCSFYKTKEQYVQELDASILRCREKELCHRCPYTTYNQPCRLSTEPRVSE